MRMHKGPPPSGEAAGRGLPPGRPWAAARPGSGRGCAHADYRESGRIHHQGDPARGLAAGPFGLYGAGTGVLAQATAGMVMAPMRIKSQPAIHHSNTIKH